MSNFSKLPNFVGKVGDFVVLSSATNFAKTLVKAGCGHVEEMKKKKDYASLKAIGEWRLEALTTTVRHFMEHFWCHFGSRDARALAEARRAEAWVLGCIYLYFFGVML